jgi:hypothetical protein
VDLLRVAALGMVVLGHWLVVDVVHRRGELTGGNVLAEVPYTHWLTLLFQTMPVFFLAGGYANATSWSAYRGEGGRWHGWLRRRITGLVWPTTLYVAVVALVVGTLALAGVASGTLARAGWLLALHLWFLSVYLVLLAMTPAQVALQRRWGAPVAAVLAGGAVVVDVAVLRFSWDAAGWAGYVLVWGCVHQLGVAWQQGGLTRHRAVPLGVAAAGLTGLVALVGYGPYPVSMVGVPGAEIQNTSPPSLALLAFACIQIGLLVAAEPLVSPRLEDPARQARVRTANGLALTVYLWHMVPVVLVAATLYRAGVMPQPEAGNAPWWLSRLLWVGSLTAVLAVIVRALLPVMPLLSRLPSGVGPPRRAAPVLVVAGSGALVAALARLAVDGFASGNQLPGSTLALFGGGLLLVLLAGAAGRPPAGRRLRPR